MQLTCPFCGKSAEAGPGATSARCPDCDAVINVTAPGAAPAPAPVEDRRPCPACQEMIKVGALLCFKCKTRLDQPLPPRGAAPVAAAAAPEAKSSNKTMWILIVVLGGILLAAGEGIIGLVLLSKSAMEHSSDVQCRFNLYDLHSDILEGLDNGKAPAEWAGKKGVAFLEAAVPPKERERAGCPAHALTHAKTTLGLRGPKEAWDGLPATAIVACDLDRNHGDHVNVLYKNGRVARVKKGESEYYRAMQETAE